ncbi:MAG: hypothetical protein JOZ71_10345 [Ktedonobacteraceae bacterium]|nr:hypothetical protein [Ktedonobacteraceae bacterium]
MQEPDNGLYKLPTTREIAKKGVAEYVFLLKNLSAKAKSLFISSLDIPTLASQGIPRFVLTMKGKAPHQLPKYTKRLSIQRCFVGISPEIAFESDDIAAFSREALEQTLQELEKYSQNFFIYHQKSIAPDQERYSLFNLLAVRQVARNYPAYFPHSKILTHPKDWLQNNWKVWADGEGRNCIRYGLLSGFPLDSAVKFSLYKRIRQKLQEGQPITQEEQELYQTAQIAASRLTHVSYFGFHAEKNNEYIRQLDEIFQQSRIRSLDLSRFQSSQENSHWIDRLFRAKLLMPLKRYYALRTWRIDDDM